MGSASETILALKPVTFHYKKALDANRIPQFGLVAEDVEKVNPDLVVRDKDGKAYSVRYEQVNAMLLNEFLKEHRKVEELNAAALKQEATINELKSNILQQSTAIQSVLARMEEQRAKIQVLNSQVELERSARDETRLVIQ